MTPDLMEEGARRLQKTLAPAALGQTESGGRAAGEIDMDVGAERILKPLTKWMSGGFLASSVLAAINSDKLTIWLVLGGTALFVVLMMYGALAWQTVTGMKRG